MKSSLNVPVTLSRAVSNYTRINIIIPIKIKYFSKINGSNFECDGKKPRIKNNPPAIGAVDYLR